MVATFYFFTDTDLLLTQTAADAFGPAGTDGAGNDQFRISSMHSSMHSASADPSAYAVCEGIVCVQEIPNTSPALVNLILKPLDRPPINFVPIRYYVYKGIRKDSLFADDATIAAAANNQLTQSIWDSQNAQNDSANTPGVAAPAAALGLGLVASAGPAFADPEPIDNLFFRTGVDAQFPVVKGGWTIGKFDGARFGFEVLLDGLGYRLRLALTRNLENYLLAPSLTGSETSDQIFSHWKDKEKILGFLDPCAFYGSFYGSQIQAKTSTGTFDVQAGDAIYNHVICLFLNRNRAYLDIRNEHNNSFAYFHNYVRQIEMAFDATATRSSIDYYRSGWPILIVEGSEFAANSAQPFNVLRIALPAGDNTLPLLYLTQGYKTTDSSGFPTELSPAGKVIEVSVQVSLTDEVSLALPNVPASAQAVACYVRLRYFKRIDPSQSAMPGSPATIVSSNYFDNLFYPLELQTVWGGDSPVKSVVHEEEIYVDATADLGIDFVGKVGLAVDSDNVTLFAFPTFVITGDDGGKSLPFSITGEVFEDAGAYLNLFVNKFPVNMVEVTPVTLPSGDVSTISVIVDPSTDGGFGSPNFSHFLALLLSKQAYHGLLVS